MSLMSQISSDHVDEQLDKRPEEDPASSPPDLFPPQDLLEPVWEHFGYPRDADGNVKADGQPTCKLCRKKVPGEGSQFLYRHLWKKHNPVYDEIKVQLSHASTDTVISHNPPGRVTVGACLNKCQFI